MRLMAARAERISFGAELRGVRIVTIGAAHAALVHLALPERAVLVDLVVDPPIGEVERLADQLRHELVEERVARSARGADAMAPRMARRAGIDGGAGRGP